MILQRTHTNSRVNFIDYVFSFKPITSLLLGSTEKTTGTNSGNGITPILEITGTITDGSSDVTITDEFNNTVTLDNSSFITGEFVQIYICKIP